MRTEEKVMLGVGISALVILGGLALYETSKPAAAATASAAGPAWIEITGPMTVPAGATIAVSAVAPAPTVVAQFESFAALGAQIATQIGLYPVGTPAPAGFPADGEGTKAMRLMAVLQESAPASSFTGARVWYHT